MLEQHGLSYAAAGNVVLRSVLLIAGLILPFSCLATLTYINVIPDFTQTHISGKDTGNGEHYCGPVAVSNSIVWLSDYRVEQLPLIYKLASTGYMNTDIRRGTRVARLLRGVAKISDELFGGYRTLEYEGWRLHPRQFSSGRRIPDINRMLSAVSKTSAAWLNVGWYTYDRVNDVYIRTGGHWVTLAGSTPGYLVLHDPAPRAGETFANEFVAFSIIHSGTLAGRNAGLPLPAQGMIRLDEGMHMSAGADVAIVDGVVYLEL